MMWHYRLQIANRRLQRRTSLPRPSVFGPRSSVLDPRSRRGVVLIVVLGMLAALALLGIAFTTFSAQEEKSSINFTIAFQNPRVDLDPAVLFLEAVGQLVADSNNPHSAIRGHSFLIRMYGNNSDFNRNGLLDIRERWFHAYDGPGDLGDTKNGVPIDFNFQFNERPLQSIWDSTNNKWVPGGGFDVDHTYPDHQNMSVAVLRADGTVLVPSFHRPGYITASDWTDITNTSGQGRRIILRPRRVDHDSKFPADLSTTSGVIECDVDNDGDGIKDSVWLDLGFPVQRTLDGQKKFKPLFAFLVIELDGKLQINPHGNLNNELVTPADHADAITYNGAPAPLGQGMSVTEVALVNVFKDLTTFTAQAGVDPNEYTWLLVGRAAGASPAPPFSVPGKWGEENLLGIRKPRAGATDPNQGNVPTGPPSSGDDEMPAVTGTQPYWAPLPTIGNYDEGLRSMLGGRYRNPADLDGDGLLAVDEKGHLVYVDPQGNPTGSTMGWGGPGAPSGAGKLGWPTSMGEIVGFEAVDESSEIDLTCRRPTDAIFGAADIEYLYRQYDIDTSSLTSRLFWLCPSLRPSAARIQRMMLAHEAWDLSRYNMFPLFKSATSANETELAGSFAGNGRFNTGGLAAPSATSGSAGLVTSATDPYVGLPVEIAAGRRLNLNRGLFNTVAGYTGVAVTAAYDPRAVARDIFILLRQLHPTNDPNATHRMAQFAVNCVDFRDPDSVMLGFEYNEDSSWQVDGNLTTVSSEGIRHLVWGTESTELVINETFAWEDPTDGPQLWFELLNPLAPESGSPLVNRVDLSGTGPDSAYQVILADRDPSTVWPPTITEPTGEPRPGTIRATLVFRNPPGTGTGTTLINAGQYFLIGPSSPPPDPTATAPTPDYDVPKGDFSPLAADVGGGAGNLRLYLRRLADPRQAHDAGPDGVDGTDDDVNPYLTVDALDVRVYSQTEVNPPLMLPPQHTSLERVHPYTIENTPHGAGTTNPHSLKLSNTNPSATQAFPVLAFNDRPFFSAMELLKVPAVPPQWLTSTFTTPTTFTSPYNPAGELPGITGTIKTGESPPQTKLNPYVGDPDYLFGHMLNFFRDLPGAANPTPGYYRLLEFVEVPSRMNGTRDPNVGTVTGDDRSDRVPGKMNLNAIWEEEVLLGHFNNHPVALYPAQGTVGPSGTDPASLPAEYTGSVPPYNTSLFKRLLASRAGADGKLFTPDDVPFRSLSTGTVNPTQAPASMKSPPFAAPSIHSTVLRGWPATSAGFPLFADTRNTSPPNTAPMGTTLPSLAAYPSFQWQPLEKISNIATTRSNMFAVWVTAGFFEVLDEDPDRLDNAANGFVKNAPPKLGAEINAETGQNIRHRAFFIIDRSRSPGYLGAPRSSAELQDILSQVVLHSRIIE